MLVRTNARRQWSATRSSRRVSPRCSPAAGSVFCTAAAPATGCRCSGARAAAPRRAGARGRADPVRRLDAAQARRRPATPAPTSSADRLRGGRTCSPSAGSRHCSRSMTPKGLVERLLGTDDGERRLTDVRHIGQALHAAAVTGAARAGGARRVAAAADRRGGRRRGRGAQPAAGDRRRRGAGVTIHGSKGLRVPGRLRAVRWDRYVLGQPRLPAAARRRRHAAAARGWPGRAGYARARDRHLAEELGEDLRLLYVAMTRARCQVVAWWAPATNRRHAPLSRLLFGEFDAAGSRRLEAGCRAMTTCASGWSHCSRPPAGPSPSRTSAPTGGPLAAAGRRAAGPRCGEFRPPARRGLAPHVLHRAYPVPARHAMPTRASAASRSWRPRSGTDEPATPAAAVGSRTVRPVEEVCAPSRRRWPTSRPARRSERSCTPCSSTSTLPRDDLAAELRERCAEAVRAPVWHVDRPGCTGRRPATGAGDTTRATCGRSPAAGFRTRRPTGRAGLRAAIGRRRPPTRRRCDCRGRSPTLLRRHLPGDDPLAGYADALEVPGLRRQRLRGLPLGEPRRSAPGAVTGGERRYVVVDYKTNWLGPPPASR